MLRTAEPAPGRHQVVSDRAPSRKGCCEVREQSLIFGMGRATAGVARIHHQNQERALLRS